MKTVEELEKEISALETKLEEAKKERAKKAEQPIDQRIAEALHAKFCRANHIDGCSWHYSHWNDPCAMRKNYLARAEALMSYIEFDIIIDTEDDDKFARSIEGLLKIL